MSEDVFIDMLEDDEEPPCEGLDETPCSHRSVAFWYSDTEDAAARLVAEAMQYEPSERENFLRDAYRGAKVQLSNANAKLSGSEGGKD